MKICSKCGIEQDIKSFFKDKSHTDGLTSSCKICYKKYKINNKDISKKWHKQFYDKNKEIIKDQNKIYYQKNKPQHNKRMKTWFENNKDRWKQYINSRRD